MSPSLKFPHSVEIKRAIAAAIRAGIEIGSIEIEPQKITIHPQRNADEGIESEYAEWKKLNPPPQPSEAGR